MSAIALEESLYDDLAIAGIDRLDRLANLFEKFLLSEDVEDRGGAVLQVFDIVPDIDLSIMRPDQELGQVSARVILGVQEALKKTRPHAVLVHGDTTTCPKRPTVTPRRTVKMRT